MIGSTVARGRSGNTVVQAQDMFLQLPCFSILVQLFERRGLIERELSHGCARNFRKMRARAVQLAHIERQ